MFNYKNSGNYPSFYLLFRTQRLGDRPETETGSICFAQLSRLYLKMDTEYRLLNVMF
jgi:hypothetical protein